MWRIRSLFTLGVVLALLLVRGEPCFSAEKPLVFFGINLRYSPRAMYSRYQPLMDYLTQNTPYRFELKVSRDYREALKDLKDGRTLISSLGDGAFVEAILLQGAIPIVKPLNEYGQPFYRCAIVVPRNSRIRSIRELEGKHFVFGSHHSITGNLIPRFLLQSAGISIRDLGSLTTLGNHDAVTKAILKGQYDAGSVKDLFAAKYRHYGLRVLAYSTPLPSVPLVVRRNAPEALKASVTRALLRLDPGNPAHREILHQWDEEFRHGFAAASVRDYREVIAMFQSIPFGCGVRCH
ncbi:MAG: phosphonate ABC transporter substrate-binding protein [Geobacteraceae bacterium GWC2_58_44]|nr:MAG: phosphonate ABC transporter substrate-binding protein [Geobacteraceae bacterium GWC2_58_44]